MKSFETETDRKMDIEKVFFLNDILFKRWNFYAKYPIAGRDSSYPN